MSVAAQSCLTTGGSVLGASCVFPFTYQGVQYNHCPSDDGSGSGQAWCSTGTDDNGNYMTDIWGYCGPNCPLFQQTTETSTVSTASTNNHLSTEFSNTITDITANTATKVPSTESSSVTNLPSNNTEPTSQTTDNPASRYSTTDPSQTYHNITG